ncbi:sigma 54-interacting transcriptional regulator [Geomicrobium sp. JCM 19039]|uniref:sigma 54-interacting transcriptional regulator n=1 Tax=Geomicrobium sp. JCM 19039 TaxID=1460636 RepID=UPI00045F20DD|nr:sigma 54-interacting transcriptional regulator [Geomicrobium sp. JCM 19039]GAK12340.1 NtrC family transcriptional regulator, ATPase domain [Geomicrobium sp. JCM 19039]
MNELVKLEKAVKVAGKPVRYQPLSTSGVTISESLQPLMEQGMAALSYPFQSLHILLDGETGTGKTYLAEKLYEMAMQRSYIEAGTPFISFNCADYAHNPELLVGQVFGMRKGAYTGASQDTQGLVEQANGGILFLDEIHRLSEAGQEMLFYLLDKGVYRRLGEATRERTAKLTLIAATTEAPHNVLLPTLLRRLSLHLTVPPLRQRPRQERSDLLNHFLHAEEEKMDASLSIDDSGRELLLTYACPGNIGQLKSDIQIACARAYLHYLNNGLSEVVIKDDFLPIKRSLNGKTADADSEPVSIYERLNELHINVLSSNQKTVEDTLQYVVNEYIEDLLTHQSREKLESGAWLNLIDADLLQTLQQAPFPLVKGSSIKLDEKRLYVIGLHLQNYRKHRHGHSSTLPAISRAPAEELEAARQLALHAQQSIGLSLPEEEINLIAHFLRTEPSDNNPWANQSVYVLLVTHGRAAASSMAEVTNTLLAHTSLKLLICR